MSAPESVLGRQLVGLLPEVYRTRDEGDLAAFLDACGKLLDLLKGTLDQLSADALPGDATGGRAAQSWILPYLAQLLDVRLVSPHVEGRRDEVAQAVAWRQRKGTLRVVEDIAEAVGQQEVEVEEGWRRVAVTPRVDVPTLPAAAFGKDEPDPSDPLAAVQHPGLPAVTPDLSRSSRAVIATSTDPSAQSTRFGGQRLVWTQANRHGIPCFPGGFDDTSCRTPDLRTPNWRRGHYHPRRVLLFAPPPLGLFPLDQVKLKWGDRRQHEDHIVDEQGEGSRRVYKPPGQRQAVTVITAPNAFTETELVITGLNFNSTLTVSGGRVTLRQVAARKLVITSTGIEGPVLVAQDCLFEEIQAEEGLVELEYCTVLERLTAKRVLASDCLLAGEVAIRDRSEAGASCIRFSRIPAELMRKAEASEETTPKVVWLRPPETTTDRPAFYDFEVCGPGGEAQRSTAFGGPGCGVLHPATSPSICFGAEDGGEIGAYHHKKYCLGAAAVLAKLEDFLPVGMEAVLVPDPRLLTAPPATTE